MKDVRVIRILRTFNMEELNSFGKFIKSPFSDSVRNSPELFNYLITFHPNYDSKFLRKQEVFKKIFPNENYNKRKIQNLIFDLTGAAEKFLAYITLQQNEIDHLLFLSRGYQNKKLTNESHRINKQIEKKLEPSFSPEKDYFSKLKQLTYLDYSYYKEINDSDNITKCIEGVFEASVLQFIFEYMQIKSNMKIAWKYHGRSEIKSKFIQSIFQEADLDKMLNVLQKDDYLKQPYIGIHFYRFKTIEDEDNTEYFYMLKNMLFDNLPALDREEKWFFHIHLANYCVFKFLKGEEVFNRELYIIYKSMLENKAYSSSESQYMDVMTFRNIIHLCISQKDFSTLKKLMDVYIEFLHPKYRNNLRNFALAHLQFVKGEFEQSLVILSSLKNEFSLFKIDVKNLLLKVYFELNYYEQIYSNIDAFKHYLRYTNELPEESKESYKTYLKHLEDLVKIKSGKSSKEIALVKSEIESKVHPSFKYWLIIKAEELSK